jgi:hypothetical protein
MAINTNDYFLSINGKRLQRGMVLDLPGLDAGFEDNNENCNSIPGPACMNIDTTEALGGWRRLCARSPRFLWRWHRRASLATSQPLRLA